jgi:hypothetical protein
MLLIISHNFANISLSLNIFQYIGTVKCLLNLQILTLQSLTGSLQGESRVFPVKFSHTGKNLFSLHGTPAMKTGFSL